MAPYFCRMRTVLTLAAVLTLALPDLRAQIAAGLDKHFGCLIEGRPGKEKPVPETLHDYFNHITPENSGKWHRVEATRDSMDWSVLDEHYAFARDRGLPFFFHTLIREEAEPGWLNDLDSAEIRAEVEEWFGAVAERYPDIWGIDVVNEAAHDGLGSPELKAAFGGAGESGFEDIVNVYKLARRYFPRARLLLNEYGILEVSSYRRYDNLARVLADSGVVDALGCQGHFLEYGRSPEHVRGRLDTVSIKSGLPVYITEFELAIANDDFQRTRYEEVFATMWEHPAVQGVTLWGYEEGKMWRDDGYLVRADGTDRPAMTWLREYLRGPNKPQDVLQAEDFDMMFGYAGYDDDDAVALDANLAKDSSFVGWRYVEMDDFGRVGLRYRADEDALVRVRLGRPEGEIVAEGLVAATGAAFGADTLELSRVLTGVEDVFVEYYGGGAGAAFALDEVGFAAPRASSLRTAAPAPAFAAYPNPASAVLHVRTETAARVRLLDVTARVVTATATSAAGQVVDVDTGALAPGTYVLEVVGEGGAAAQLITVE